MGEENISIKEFQNLSHTEQKTFSKDVLLKIILNTDTSQDFSELSLAIKGLKDIVSEFREEQIKDSTTIVYLKTELEKVKDENAKIKKDFSSRINGLEQRTRINNVEIIGLKKPSLMETDASVPLTF